eukprot:5507373-Prorocentrum_lima.AAC.1
MSSGRSSPSTRAAVQAICEAHETVSACSPCCWGHNAWEMDLQQVFLDHFDQSVEDHGLML